MLGWRSRRAEEVFYTYWKVSQHKFVENGGGNATEPYAEGTESTPDVRHVAVLVVVVVIVVIVLL